MSYITSLGAVNRCMQAELGRIDISKYIYICNNYLNVISFNGSRDFCWLSILLLIKYPIFHWTHATLTIKLVAFMGKNCAQSKYSFRHACVRILKTRLCFPLCMKLIFDTRPLTNFGTNTHFYGCRLWCNSYQVSRTEHTCPTYKWIIFICLHLEL